MVHAEMCEDWGYDRLSESFKKRSITEMHHAERLIERILFLEGTPIVSKLDQFSIGSAVPEQVDNDHAMEVQTMKDYNDAIVLAGNVLDYATREVLQAILKDEDRHVDELEDLQDQIEQMSLQIFLSTQNQRFALAPRATMRGEGAAARFTGDKRAHRSERWLTTFAA